MKPSFRNFAEFWPYYLAQHSKAATRRYHFIGTSLVFVCLLGALLYRWWFILLAPLLAYGFAWYSHFFIEGNKPATFGHPFWSLRADFRMFWRMLTGSLDKELRKHGLDG